MGLIPDEIIAQIIDRSDIVDIISSYVPLKKAGRNYKALSPFNNEKTPSFFVNPEKQIFHCFSSGIGGNVITFVMKMERIDFPEAVRILAQRVNIEIPQQTWEKNQKPSDRHDLLHINQLAADYFHQRLVTAKDQAARQARNYLKSRDVSLETVKQFYLGFVPDQWDSLIKHLQSKQIPVDLMEKAGLVIAREKASGYYDRFRNRIIFPIFDTRGHCRAFGARALDDSSAKYINSPETTIYTKGQHLYGFHLAKDAILEADRVIMVEGYVDCLMPHQHGFKNVVASLGTALTLEQVRLLRRYTKNVTLLFDADRAGEMAMLRSLDMLIEEGMHIDVAKLDSDLDPDSFIRQHGAEAFRDRLVQTETLFDFKLGVLTKQYPTKTLPGKTAVATEMMATIERYPDGLVKQDFVRRLAHKLHVSESDLWMEWKKGKANSLERLVEKTHQHQQEVQTVFNRLERGILKLLMEEKDLISVTKEEIKPEDFEDSQVRGIISKLYDLFDQGEELTMATVLKHITDMDSQKVISEIMIDDSILFGDRQKMHSDFVQKMKTNRLKIMRRKLLDEIRQAEAAGDHLRLDVLKKDFNQLIRS